MSKQEEIIQLNPGFNLDAALREKENKKKQMVVIDTADEARNMLDARFEAIRSYIHSRNDKLTIAFHYVQEKNVWEVGIALPWGDILYGLPPSAPEFDKEFGAALFDAWVEANQMGEKAYRLRHVVQDGRVSGGS